MNLSPIKQVIFNVFNLLVTTFTVVGYGANMPAYTNDAEKLSLFILFGVLLFSSLAGQLQMLFNDYEAVLSIADRLDQIEENIEIYFIKHNQLNRHWNVRELNAQTLNEFKQIMRLDFKFCYKKLQKDDMYNQLNPQIKQKIEKVITKEQRQSFSLFFSSISDSFKVPARVVRKMLSHLNCQIFD